MEMRCYRKILHISYKDHVTNEEVRAKIRQAIGPLEDLIIVKRRKLQWYGLVSRSSGLAKTILQSTVRGGRRQDRQRKRWEDTIREWTGLEFAMSLCHSCLSVAGTKASRPKIRTLFCFVLLFSSLV